MRGEIYRDKQFFMLMCDAARFASLSNAHADLADEYIRSRAPRPEHDPYFDMQRFARACVITCTCCLECAANCCVDSLPHGGGLKNDVEKLPFLSKFEIYFAIKHHGAALERGRAEVEAVQDLKRLRDLYVHPKVRKAEVRQVSEGTSEIEDAGETTCLQISRDAGDWTNEDAVRALRATIRFLDWFFLDTCAYDADTVCGILVGSEEVSIPSSTHYSLGSASELRDAVVRLGLDLAFLGETRTKSDDTG